MINYKKSLLSVATATAIMTSSLGADYLPLTTVGEDFQWVSIGISGLKSDGIPAGQNGVFTIDGVVEGEAENVITDDSDIDLLPVSGMERGGKDMVKLDAITTSPIEIRIDTTGHTYDETDPVKTMYITSAINGAPQFAVEFKSELEGQKLEFSIDGAAARETTLDSTKIFSDPAVSTQIQGIPAVPGVNLESLTETKSVVDYQFADNPVSTDEWNETDHRDDISDQLDVSTLRVYSYNAQDLKWEIYDSRNDSGTNDFTALQNAKGYWARLDNENTDGGGTTLSVANWKESGLVLGDPSLSTADYTAANLTDGWNFIAFDGQQSTIRNSVTGMLLEVDGDASIDIIDSTGNHTLTIAVTGFTNNDEDVAKEINAAVTAAVAAGTMPKTFDVRAFAVTTAAAAGRVAVISNRKFTVAESGGDAVNAATALGGGTLLHTNDGTADEGIDLVAVTDLGATPANSDTGAMSKYGEHAMIIEPIIDTVADLTAQWVGEATIQISGATSSTAISLAAGAAADAIDEVVTALDAHADTTALQIDLGNDGTAEHVLLVDADNTFAIRDHTFTRAFTFDNQGSDSLVTFSGGGSENIHTAQTLTQNVGDLDTTLGANVRVVEDADGKMLFISNDSVNNYVAETLADNIQISTSGQDEARGAIKSVISLGSLVGTATSNTHTIDTFAHITDDALDTLTFSYDTPYGTLAGTAVTPGAGAYTADESSAADNEAFFDDLVTQIQADLVTLGLTSVSVSHDYTTQVGAEAAKFAATTVTVVSTDILAIGTAINENGGGATTATDTADNGYLASYSGDLATDLKYNYVYTPDYAMNGPLYTMKDNGMELRALVSGTTDIATGVVNWESIDLTRLPSEWLDSQDYDLFEVSPNVGYWAYLVTSPETSLTVSDIALSKNYVHHFDYDIGDEEHSTTNYFSGNLDVYVAGISNLDDEQSARVTATIGGETIELTQSTSDDSLFSGQINTREAKGVNVDTNYPLTINIADGFGNNASYDYNSTFDNDAPSAPVVSMINGEVNIAANAADTDVAGFYVFNGIPLEADDPQDQHDAALGVLTAPGAVSVACDGQAAAAWDDPADGITVIAVDGDGTLGSGNASDADSIDFMRIMLDRALVTATNVGGTWESTSEAYDFNSSCVNTGLLSVDTGVTASSLTSDQTVKFAYPSLGAATGHEVPLTVYVVSDQSGTYTRAEAAITYPENYAGEDVFIELGERVYGFQLPTRAVLTAGGVDSGASSAEADLMPLISAPNNNPKAAGIRL